MSAGAPLRALIFDVDGTLAETERDGHRIAFNEAFTQAGLPWRWDVPTYGHWLRVAGGRERLRAFIETCADAPTGAAARDALAAQLHRLKNAAYVALVAAGTLRARPGVQRLLDECRTQGVRVAIATTTGRGNVEALFPHLFGARWREWFTVLLCAEDAPRKKPDPQVYALALQRLNVAAVSAIAIEDSPAGLAAARAAGLRCLITRSTYFHDADFPGASAVVDDLDASPPWPAAGATHCDLQALRALVQVAPLRTSYG